MDPVGSGRCLPDPDKRITVNQDTIMLLTNLNAKRAMLTSKNQKQKLKHQTPFPFSLYNKNGFLIKRN